MEVQTTPVFRQWVASLRDRRAQNRIAATIDRIRMGNLGDTQSLRGGISEMRIHYGPGYRLYFTRRDRTLIVLLCGGDKDSQSRDIIRAQQLAQEWR